MYFPFETTFRTNGGVGVIRLKVAAICICLDEDKYFDEEAEPFFRTVEMTGLDGNKFNSPIDPHAFLYLRPTGNLEHHVNDVLNALVVSIDKGQLTPVSLRIGLDGVIDVIETWITTEDFYSWCSSRNLFEGDMCSTYDEGESAIVQEALDGADDRRGRLEAPHFDAEYQKESGIEADSREISKEMYEKMNERYEMVIRENVILRQGFLPPEEAVDRPLRTRERNGLLAIIAVLCREAKYDFERPAKTAGLIKAAAQLMGLDIGESTIENHLKRIPEAIETRAR